ncbi:MAG: HEPN domain-containing protein [Desulfurispora sp.]
MRRLTYYYIETRYPDKRLELEARCTNQLVRETLHKAKEVLLWLKKELN